MPSDVIYTQSSAVKYPVTLARYTCVLGRTSTHHEYPAFSHHACVPFCPKDAAGFLPKPFISVTSSFPCLPGDITAFSRIRKHALRTTICWLFFSRMEQYQHSNFPRRTKEFLSVVLLSNPFQRWWNPVSGRLWPNFPGSHRTSLPDR